MTSKVQALLDINPQEVFSLRIQTDKGHAFIPVSLEGNHEHALGLWGARMVAPDPSIKCVLSSKSREFAENPCGLLSICGKMISSSTNRG